MSEFLIPLTLITGLILLNGLFVAAEFAIIGVRPTRVAQLVEEGNRTAASIKQILDSPQLQDRYIATAQLGITIASLGLGMYGEHVVAEWLLGPLERWIDLDETTAHAVAAVVAISLLTFAHVVVGEMVPKSLALQYAERTVLGIAGIMRLAKFLSYPAVGLLNALGNGMLRAIGIPPAAALERVYSPKELVLLVEESHEGGLLTDNEERLLHNIFDLSERRVRQVMTPRLRIAAIPLDIGEKELLKFVAASPYSRFPVYDGDLDHIVGLLLLKDVIRHQISGQRLFDLKKLLRHMPVVPETLRVEQLLVAFKRSKVHMALVIDEYGGAAGLVTLEDLVEEVVGEVHDEFDQGELPPIRQLDSGVLLVRGDVLIEDLREDTVIDLPEEEDLPDVETVGGLVISLLGRPAQPNNRVVLNETNFIVERVDGRAVALVRIEIDPDHANGAVKPEPHLNRSS
jgi:CBS domain containing-hemolysin-like protein